MEISPYKKLRSLYLIIILLLPATAFSQLQTDAFGETYLTLRVEPGVQNKKFYTGLGLQLYLPGEKLIHGPYAGANFVFLPGDIAVQPQLGYHAALAGFYYTGVDFTLITNEPGKPVMCQPKLGLTFLTWINVFYSRGFALSKRESKSAFNQIGFSFLIPIEEF